jgi:peptide/nickel transport system permease protein
MNIFLRQVFSAIVVIWLAATLAFFALRILPGDALEAQLLESGASAEVIAQRRAQLGLDVPLIAQYLQFLSGLLRGNLGYSLLNGESVSETIGVRVAPTMILAVSALVIAAGLGFSLGALAGMGRGFAKNIISLSLSMPIYWTGTLVIYAASALSLMGDASQTILPIGVLGFHAAGAIARVLQGQVSEILHADFVQTARAKGLRERAVIGRHILRLALLPVVSVIALQAGYLLTGTVITESLFARPGIGRLLVERTLAQDYPVVQGIVVLAAVIYTLVNTLADGIQRLLDPRLRSR